jgi:two-component system nitrate/nitrite sensor histidine kinase NarX
MHWRNTSTTVLLQHGDPARPLFVPWNAEARQRFAQIRQRWLALRPAWTTSKPLAASEVVRQANDFVTLIDAFDSTIEAQLTRWTAILNAAQIGLLMLAIAGSFALYRSSDRAGTGGPSHGWSSQNRSG